MKTIQFPPKATFLFKPAPYKIGYGGRGGAKSWSYARALLLLARRKKLRILCCREIQKSIAESVHKLLCEQAVDVGLGFFFQPRQHSITGMNGSEFIFAGLRHNVNQIKSMEGVDLCWVEEAHLVSDSSWEILLPTIRRDAPFGPLEKGSEIWISFNPELETDATYRRFIVDPPKGAIRVEFNWRDNPWFPEFLMQQKEDLKKRDYDSYLTVWEGKCRATAVGAIYAKEIQQATLQDRINPHVVVDRSRPVDLSWDLGRADMTAIWFWQQIGMHHHAIKYHEDCGHDITHYIAFVQSTGYQIGTIYLPADARAERIEFQFSVEAQIRRAFPNARVVTHESDPGHAVAINATRMLFPRLYFNQVECDTGLHALRHYQYAVEPDKVDGTKMRRSPTPVHDWASHGARALDCYATGIREHDKPAHRQHVRPPKRFSHPQGWMNA